MRTLKRKNECPPDGFKYVHPETGHATVAFDPYNWVEKAKEHRRANGLPIPEDFELQMMDQLCSTLPAELCDYQTGDPQWVNTRLDWRDVFFATRALVDTALGNFVSQDEAERRAKICAGCQFNVALQGCGTCRGLAELIAKGRSTSYDDKLQNCAICRCYNRPQVHIKLTTLSDHASAERQSKYPDFCWQKIGGSNYIEDAI